jgi:hypothetical protein
MNSSAKWSAGAAVTTLLWNQILDSTSTVALGLDPGPLQFSPQLADAAR